MRYAPLPPTADLGGPKDPPQWPSTQLTVPMADKERLPPRPLRAEYHPRVLRYQGTGTCPSSAALPHQAAVRSPALPCRVSPAPQQQSQPLAQGPATQKLGFWIQGVASGALLPAILREATMKRLLLCPSPSPLKRFPSTDLTHKVPQSFLRV